MILAKLLFVLSIVAMGSYFIWNGVWNGLVLRHIRWARLYTGGRRAMAIGVFWIGLGTAALAMAVVLILSLIQRIGPI